MPIKFWEPPVTERGADELVLSKGMRYSVKPWDGEDADDGKEFLLITGKDAEGKDVGLIFHDDDWEEFDDLIREYRNLRKLRRKGQTSEPRVQPVESKVEIGEPLEDEPATDPPTGRLAINMSAHALQQHLKKPGGSFNVNGTVWERRGDGMFWHIGGPLADGLGESLDNADALALYAGKSITVTEG